MKKILWVLALLLTVSICFGEVNWGIQTRTKWERVIWPVADTVFTDTTGIGGTPEDSLYALDTVGYAIFDVRSLAEQGLSMMVALSDSSDSLDMWMATGGKINYFGFNGIRYSDSVRCLWSYRMTAAIPAKPVNLAFVQSLVLVDSTDYNIGYMPGDYLKFTVINRGIDRDTVSVEDGNGTWPYYRDGDYTDLIIKVWFK